MERNKRDNCVIKSRYLSNDGMMRRNKRDKCVTYLVHIIYQKSCSLRFDETKQAR